MARRKVVCIGCMLGVALRGEDARGVAVLNLEAGYARAKGKVIVLVDEKSPADARVAKHLGMLRSVADVIYASLPAGIEYLHELSRMPWR